MTSNDAETNVEPAGSSSTPAVEASSSPLPSTTSSPPSDNNSNSSSNNNTTTSASSSTATASDNSNEEIPFDFAQFGVRASKVKAFQNMSKSVSIIKAAPESNKKSTRITIQQESENEEEVLTTPSKKKNKERVEDSGGEEAEEHEAPKPKAKKKSGRKIVKHADEDYKTTFKELAENIYVGSVKPIVPFSKRADTDGDYEKCTCTRESKCGESCINRLMKIECNPELCPCQEECTNIRFQRRQWSDVEVVKTEKKGWGLITRENIKKGQFIIEYVGEIVDNETLSDRMMEYDGGRHFYFLRLNAHETIDASRKGNKARFANHSCNPNCVTQKWDVGGACKVGLFAIKDIKAGSEITFDYCFETYGNSTLLCYCGEKNCRGTITAKESSKATKSKEDIDKEFRNKAIRRTKSYLSNYVKEITKFKVDAKLKEFAHGRQLFLLRNLKRGHKMRTLSYSRFKISRREKNQQLEEQKDEAGLLDWQRENIKLFVEAQGGDPNGVPLLPVTHLRKSKFKALQNIMNSSAASAAPAKSSSKSTESPKKKAPVEKSPKSPRTVKPKRSRTSLSKSKEKKEEKSKEDKEAKAEEKKPSKKKQEKKSEKITKDKKQEKKAEKSSKEESKTKGSKKSKSKKEAEAETPKPERLQPAPVETLVPAEKVKDDSKGETKPVEAVPKEEPVAPVKESKPEASVAEVTEPVKQNGKSSPPRKQKRKKMVVSDSEGEPEPEPEKKEEEESFVPRMKTYAKKKEKKLLKRKAPEEEQEKSQNGTGADSSKPKKQRTTKESAKETSTETSAKSPPSNGNAVSSEVLKMDDDLRLALGMRKSKLKAIQKQQK